MAQLHQYEFRYHNRAFQKSRFHDFQDSAVDYYTGIQYLRHSLGLLILGIVAVAVFLCDRLCLLGTPSRRIHGNKFRTLLASHHGTQKAYGCVEQNGNRKVQGFLSNNILINLCKQVCYHQPHHKTYGSAYQRIWRYSLKIVFNGVCHFSAFTRKSRGYTVKNNSKNKDEKYPNPQFFTL